MNYLKKLNTYLLENYPLIWHSKAIQLTFAGIAFWTISYFVGFAMINLKTLQYHLIHHYYNASGFMYFHFTYVIIILSIWALYFYKNNAFKSYYPLKKGYFIVLFSTLFFAFFILASAYIPFTNGCKTKARSLFDEKNLQSDIDKLNIGNAFLISSPSEYNLDNRSYPEPYPVEMIRYNENYNSWDEIPGDIILPVQFDSLIEKKSGYWSDVDLPKNKTRVANSEYYWTSSRINDKYTVIVDGRKMQFYSTHTIYVKIDKCLETSKTYLSKFYSLDELDHPELNSIINFSEVLIEEPYRSFKNDKLLISNNERYAPIVHKLVRDKNPIEIKKAIDNFVEVCNKYQIENTINSTHLLRYLTIKKNKNFYHSIIHYWKNNAEYYNAQNEMDLIEASVSDTSKFIEIMDKQQAYHYNQAGLFSLFNNHSYLIFDSFLSYYDFLIFMYISFFITWVFMFFEFASIKSLLITIPVTGVLLIINVMIIVFSDFRDHGAFITFILTFLIIISLTLFGLRKKIINKKVLNILMNLSYMIAPIFLIMIILFYNELTKEVYVQTECNGMQIDTQDSIFVGPYLFFTYSVLGLLLFIPLLKKWKALEE